MFEKLSKFLPKIGTENKITREKWLRKTLLSIPEGSKILDAGAGELQYKKYCNHLEYVSQDFGKYDGKGDGEGFQFGNYDNSQLDIVSDITDIPQPDQSFDVIMCVEVLEHLTEPIKAIKEMARLLRPGGRLILTAPFNSLTHFSPFFYYTGYSQNFYEYFLNEFDFNIEEIQKNGNYFEYLAQELWRLPRMVEKYSRRNYPVVILPLVLFLLLFLSWVNKKDIESNGLLCMGIMVTAIKREIDDHS
ncbi:MAG: class I SAM-dependent methyltransferase [Anaerolineaceae bacterium]|nr:class I SAM-dependent methyltransferase [Anaerolineaceae bacterium]